MTFAYRIVAAPDVEPELVKDADFAIRQWSNRLSGQGELVVKIEYGTQNIHRAGGVVNPVADGTFTAFNGTRRNLTITSVDSVLRDGIHNTNYGNLVGTGADVIIRIDKAFAMQNYFIDPTPETSTDIPPDRVDMISVIEHEFGHALGIQGYYPLDATNTASLGGTESGFDRWVNFGSDNRPSFVGQHAEAVFGGGGPVPLEQFPSSDARSFENIYHLRGVGVGLQDLMNGVDLLKAFRYTISPLDVALVQDASGLSTTPLTPLFAVSQASNIRPELTRGDTLTAQRATTPQSFNLPSATVPSAPTGLMQNSESIPMPWTTMTT
jgi:hypothetical protein